MVSSNVEGISILVLFVIIVLLFELLLPLVDSSKLAMRDSSMVKKAMRQTMIESVPVVASPVSLNPLSNINFSIRTKFIRSLV